jgi:hypothetical protein
MSNPRSLKTRSSDSLTFLEVRCLPHPHMRHTDQKSLELRNGIYEIAVDETARTWPLSRGKKDKTLHRLQSSSTLIARQDKKPYPFIGLVNSCSQIRLEFRKLWMTGHRVGMANLEEHLSIFFPDPARPSKNSSNFNPAGQLKIHVKGSDFKVSKHIQILRVLKLKARFPDFDFTFVEMCSDAPGVAVLNALINNKHPGWLRWIRGRALSRVRLEKYHDARGHISIVVNEKYAPPWMKSTLNQRVSTEYLRGLGLDAIEPLLAFSVCYV